MIVDIRKMQDYDVYSVSKIEEECFSKPWSIASISEELKNENASFHVAEISDEIVGYIGSYIAADECYIDNVAVLPSHRRMKIASLLVNEIIMNAKNNACSFVSLEVRLSNEAAIELYKNFGFEIKGQRPGFYSEPTEDALIMTKVIV